jgi:hypothetical protein
LRDLLWPTTPQDLPSLIPSFGTKINDLISGLDHVHVMLNDDDRIAGISQPVENIQEFLNIGEMEPSGWFIQDVDRSPRASLAQFS